MLNSLIKFIKSFKYAFNGLIYAIKVENNFRYHLLATATLLILGFHLQFNSLEWIIVILLIGVVFAAEIFNTAIEKLVDLISPDYHKQAGLVKDLSAAAVLASSIAAAIVGIIILYNKIFEY